MRQTDDVYIYNDTFLSLLALSRELYKLNIRPFAIKNTKYSLSLLDNSILLEQNELNIISYFLKIVSKDILKTCYYVFLSKDENKELIIFYFLLNAIKYSNKVYYMRNLNCVVKALQISNRVSRELHKFKGFTRFKEFKNGVLYAEIEPDNDILYLLSIHFSKRFKNEVWIINDKRRKMLSFYDKKKFDIISDTKVSIDSDNFSQEEGNIEELWKTFYNNIGIKERKNDRCRMNFMPKKYWKNILEVEDINEKNR